MSKRDDERTLPKIVPNISSIVHVGQSKMLSLPDKITFLQIVKSNTTFEQL